MLKVWGVFQLIFPVLVFCIALSCGGIKLLFSRFVAESKKVERNVFLCLSTVLLCHLVFLLLPWEFCIFFAEPVSLFIIKNKSCTELLKIRLFHYSTCHFSRLHNGLLFRFQKKLLFQPGQVLLNRLQKLFHFYLMKFVWVEKGISITPVIAVYSMVISELCGVIFCLIYLVNVFFAF